MKVQVELTTAEVAALEAEKLTPDETLESVIRRQISPLLFRLVTLTFDSALTKYKGLELVEQFDASMAFDQAVTKKPRDEKPPIEEVPVVVEVTPGNGGGNGGGK